MNSKREPKSAKSLPVSSKPTPEKIPFSPRRLPFLLQAISNSPFTTPAPANLHHSLPSRLTLLPPPIASAASNCHRCLNSPVLVVRCPYRRSQSCAPRHPRHNRCPPRSHHRPLRSSPATPTVGHGVAPRRPDAGHAVAPLLSSSSQKSCRKFGL
ncbi:hypothetical protein GUJ93_ZPchr1014g14 [Zizania palustris]|uniref:Uncharacterized protein n=1 Tax=Zizania palustris TaxID=103762 RepID=A0A8J5W5I8_ZIZPA|nr:hypothetical protein GUJ93_ZPchr1014g14 [Zizania palustris]